MTPAGAGRPPLLSGNPYRDLLVVAILATVLALYARTFLLLPIRIPTESMVATLLPGDRVLTDRSVFGFPLRQPRRGDVLTFLLPEPHPRMVVKRCIGLPGETIEVDSQGRIRIEGRAPNDPQRTGSVPEPDWSPDLRIELSESQYFVLGDNRARSRDSRHWGPIERSWIRGRVVLIYWSTSAPIPISPEATAAAEAGGWGKMIELSKRRLESIRWERAFEPVR